MTHSTKARFGITQTRSYEETEAEAHQVQAAVATVLQEMEVMNRPLR
jgi:hypothetical protein